MNETPDKYPTIIRPSRSTYFIAVAFLGPLVAGWIYLSFRDEGSDYTGLLVTAAFLAFIIYLIGSHSIHFGDGKLVSSGPFFSKSEIPIDDIKKVIFRVGGNSYKERLLPPFRIEIHSKSNSSRNFWINAKLYSMTDIRYLMQLGNH